MVFLNFNAMASVWSKCNSKEGKGTSWSSARACTLNIIMSRSGCCSLHMLIRANCLFIGIFICSRSWRTPFTTKDHKISRQDYITRAWMGRVALVIEMEHFIIKWLIEILLTVPCNLCSITDKSMTKTVLSSSRRGINYDRLDIFAIFIFRDVYANSSDLLPNIKLYYNSTRLARQTEFITLQ